MVENHLHWTIVYWKSKDVDNILKGYKLNLQSAIGSKAPASLLNFYFKYTFCRKGLKRVRSNGMGVHTAEEKKEEEAKPEKEAEEKQEEDKEKKEEKKEEKEKVNMLTKLGQAFSKLKPTPAAPAASAAPESEAKAEAEAAESKEEDKKEETVE